MSTIQYQLTDGIATLTFDEPNSPVNTMCLDWQADLTAAAAQLSSDKDNILGIILASHKSTFFAGADLKGVMRLQAGDSARCFAQVEQIKKNFRTIETLGKPVVSCLNGSALGGGWELALVGHYRIAVNDKKLKLGLPEVTLGLLPGASGVTKMTRLLGLVKAQPFLIEGKIFGAQEAFDMGLVHALISDAADLRAQAVAYIRTHIGNPDACTHPWDSKGYRMPGGTPASPALAGALSLAPALLHKHTRGLLPAPEAILACMVEGALVDYDTALRIESRYLAKLVTSSNAKAMINTFFFDMNAVKSSASRAKDTVQPQPGLPGGGLPINSVYTSRTFGTYQMEGAAMLSEGIPAVVIDNAAMQMGMTTSPLSALLKEPTPPNFAAQDKADMAWNIQTLKDRLLYRQAIETARCLHEGVLSTVPDANISAIFGMGFPVWTGGTMQFIYGMGIDTFTQRAAQLAAAHGAGFALDAAVVQTIRQYQPVY